MTSVYSLRQRLFVLILTPLLMMAIFLGIWRFTVAQRTAEELFDRALLSSALAISRDVAISGGDALLPSTSDMIFDATGGQVFYHVTGPGGIYVTGYAYPPAAEHETTGDLYVPVFFEAAYRSEGVRVLQITERVAFDGVTGNATVTVWQRLSERNKFAAQLAQQAAALMGGLLVTLALVVWFGVKLGLRPLLDLENAIGRRSPDDLSEIRRAVPVETEGIVSTLNRLLVKVQDSMTAHQVFISNAAHQLRNPAAAVQSMAEALRDAPTKADQQHRLNELVRAARDSARVAEQLLSMDRLRQPMPDSRQETFDLAAELKAICSDIGADVLSVGVDFEVIAPTHPVPMQGDRLFIGEAVKNLIFNSMRHGGAKLSAISVTLAETEGQAHITVADDGVGLSPQDSAAALGRFSQVEPSEGSGLGLAIASSVAQHHGGTLVINEANQGASLTFIVTLKG